MNREMNITVNTDVTPIENTNESERKTYNAPKLTNYGSLAELVKTNLGVGPDGGPFADCTAS